MKEEEGKKKKKKKNKAFTKDGFSIQLRMVAIWSWEMAADRHRGGIPCRKGTVASHRDAEARLIRIV